MNDDQTTRQAAPLDGLHDGIAVRPTTRCSRRRPVRSCAASFNARTEQNDEMADTGPVGNRVGVLAA